MTHQPHQTRHWNRPRATAGFTIIELMVVVSLIALLLSFSVPLVFKIDELSRDRTGINTFGVAVTAARAYATRGIADVDSVPQSEYSGAAILVTPFNELRIIADLQIDELEAAGKSAFGYDTQTSRMEPIAMPRGVGVAGIVRNGTGATGVALLPPPFAIRFNRHGQLLSESRTTDANQDIKRNVVYYDSDLDGSWEDVVRPGGYSPNAYDPDANPTAFAGQWVAGKKDYKMAFEALESVVGVVVYAKADFEDAGGTWPTTAPKLGCTGGCGTGIQGIQKWMLENGTIMFFSRNTGNILRTKRQ